MAVEADTSGAFRSVWVGDSLLAKPRLESIVLLSAIASRTERVRLGTACMASFPVRDPILLAQQWASLDLLSGGRTVLIACTGINPQEAVEDATYGVDPRERANRIGQWISVDPSTVVRGLGRLRWREHPVRRGIARAQAPPDAGDLDRQ